MRMRAHATTGTESGAIPNAPGCSDCAPSAQTPAEQRAGRDAAVAPRPPLGNPHNLTLHLPRAGVTITTPYRPARYDNNGFNFKQIPQRYRQES